MHACVISLFFCSIKESIVLEFTMDGKLKGFNGAVRGALMQDGIDILLVLSTSVWNLSLMVPSHSFSLSFVLRVHSSLP